MRSYVFRRFLSLLACLCLILSVPSFAEGHSEDVDYAEIDGAEEVPVIVHFPFTVESLNYRLPAACEEVLGEGVRLEFSQDNYYAPELEEADVSFSLFYHDLCVYASAMLDGTMCTLSISADLDYPSKAHLDLLFADFRNILKVLTRAMYVTEHTIISPDFETQTEEHLDRLSEAMDLAKYPQEQLIAGVELQDTVYDYPVNIFFWQEEETNFFSFFCYVDPAATH